MNTDFCRNKTDKKTLLNIFKKNCYGLNEGNNFDEDFLLDLFNSIIKNPLRLPNCEYGERKRCGSLLRKKFFGWSEYYFMLNTKNELYYYNSIFDELSDIAIGFFDLSDVKIDVRCSGDKYIFTVSSSCEYSQINAGRFVHSKLKEESFSSLVFATSDVDELEDWCDAILGNFKTLSSANAAKSAKK